MPLFFPAAFRDIPGLMPKQSDLSRFIRLTGRNGEPNDAAPVVARPRRRGDRVTDTGLPCRSVWIEAGPGRRQ